MKDKLLVLMAGLAMFLCAAPALAEEATITIPYAVHGEDWWSGLALTNTGTSDITVKIEYSGTVLELIIDLLSPSSSLTPVISRKKITAGTVTVAGLSTVTQLLPDFFTNGTYPDFDGGRIMLFLTGEGDTAQKDLKVTMFIGNTGADGGFSYQVFRHGD